MSATRRLGRKPIDQLRESPLASHVDAFAQHLRDCCYAAHTIGKYLGCLAHFGRWMGRCQLQAGRLDEDAVERFLDDHLPRCDCPGPVVCTRIDLHAALGHLLVVLRDSGAISERPISTTPVDEELRRFDAQMDHAQGLALKTRTSHLRTIRRLLIGQFGAGAVDISAIKPEDVRQFVATQSELYSTPSSAAALISALRGYFRFRTACGDQVHALVGVLSSPANLTAVALPCPGVTV